MDCFWIDYHLENVDIQVLLTIGVQDICDSTFHSEFGGHFVFQFQTLSRTVKKLLSALALISGIHRTYLDR